jgi:hypothetical protein
LEIRSQGFGIGVWGLGFGDWGLGVGGWGLRVGGRGFRVGGIDEERERVALLISFRRPTFFLILTAKIITGSNPEGVESPPEAGPNEY